MCARVHVCVCVRASVCVFVCGKGALPLCLQPGLFVVNNNLDLVNLSDLKRW